jgi:hypothetical protein
MPRLNKNNVNVTQVFLTYTALVGDVEKTAAALDLDPDYVRKLAADEGWQSKLERICLIGKGGKPGDWERASNRALCFVQAHQTREIIGRVISRFQDMDDDEIFEAIASIAKDGSRHVSGRFFADLTAAMEKCHQMAYCALGDTAGERKENASDDADAVNATALHAAVLSALNNPKVNAIDVASEIVKETESKVKELAASSVPTEPASFVPTTDS